MPGCRWVGFIHGAERRTSNITLRHHVRILHREGHSLFAPQIKGVEALVTRKRDPFAVGRERDHFAERGRYQDAIQSAKELAGLASRTVATSAAATQSRRS